MNSTNDHRQTAIGGAAEALEALADTVRVAQGAFVVGARQRKIAGAILAAGYRLSRTVSTVEELDALPENTVIREHQFGSIHQRGSKHWWGIASSRPTPGKIPLPITVLYVPDSPEDGATR